METKIVCSVCGSEDIQAQVWVKLNENFRTTTEFVDEMIREEAYCWCCQCEENRKLIIQKSKEPVASKNDTMHCSECGSTNVQTQAWIDPNNNNSFVNSDDEEGWCGSCEQHLKIIPRSELMKDIEYWWEHLDNGEDREVITGLISEDYDPANDYQAFDEACDEVWSAKTDDEKIEIWQTLTQRGDDNDE